MTERISAPYGTWPSPLSATDLAAGAISFADLATDGESVFWLQADPADGGRAAVMRHTPGEGFIVRSLEARLAFYGRVLGFAPADDIALPEFTP